MQYFEQIAPGEENVLTFIFAPGLPSGVTLTGSPTVTVKTIEGVDANPTGILNGSSALDGTSTMVLVPVAPTVDGVQYVVRVLCATTQSNIKLALPAILPVSSLS